MITEKTLIEGDFAFQIVEADDEFVVLICPAEDFLEDTTTPFHLVDILKKDNNYDFEIIEAMIRDKDFLLYAVKRIVDNQSFKLKCNASMSSKMAENASKNDNKNNKETDYTELSVKPLLTVKEMAKYSGIGEAKLYWIIDNYASYKNNFVLKIGNKNLIKKKQFLEFISENDEL